MPVITGDEFIAIVRASKLNKETPLILSSAYINKVVTTELTRESKIYFLAKPFDSKSLIETVTKALGVKREEVSGNAELADQWVQQFSEKIHGLTKEKNVYEKVEQFELWNFESINLNCFAVQGSEAISVTLLMKPSTFLKIAGKIRGTQYKDIDAEALHIWQDQLTNNEDNCVTFSKVLSQEIITLPDQTSSFYKLTSNDGEILIYLN